MSEKRFIWKCDDENCQIYDTKKKKAYFNVEVVDLLNEQQNTIQFLQNEIDELKKDVDIYEYEEKKHSETARKLYDENEQLRNRLTFLNKVISFFADNPMTKYSSKSELLEEMRLLEKMGLI